MHLIEAPKILISVGALGSEIGTSFDSSLSEMIYPLFLAGIFICALGALIYFKFRELRPADAINYSTSLAVIGAASVLSAVLIRIII